jgi:hypothetical protein
VEGLETACLADAGLTSPSIPMQDFSGSTKRRRMMEGDGAAAARADGNSSAGPEPSI